MLRFKDYNATGIAPDGRLYAGDLNLLQDLVAALASYTQNLSVGSLTVGEAGLSISRYGAGEFSVAGLARVTGILRALNGFVAGTFTTAARDAIAAGSRPFGLMILNTTTARYEWNSGTDAAPNWVPISPPLTAGSIGTTELAAGAVTLAKVAADVPVIPVGAVIEFPWSSGSIPAWSALPYGQAIARATYPAMATLDDASGQPHGVSAGNVVLPDYRGRGGVGKDNMGGAAANRITVAISGVSGSTLGAVFGAEGITLTTAQLPAHNHGVTGVPSLSDPTHTHSTNGDHYTGTFGSAGGGTAVVSQMTADTINASATGITVGVGTLGTSNTGSGSAHQNTQPSIIVNLFMRVQ